MARTRKATYGQPLEAVLNRIMAHLRKQASAVGGDQYGRFEGSLETQIGPLLGLPRRNDTRYSGTTTYTAVLYWLKQIKPLSRAVTGGPADKAGSSRPSVYLIKMKGTITRDDVLRFRVHNAERQREMRQRRQREERAAGDTPDTTTGGPVTTRHYHTEILAHEHGGKAGIHFHGPLIDTATGPEGLDSMVIWGDDDGRTTRALRRQEHERAATPDQHTDVRHHQHGTRTGTHKHDGYRVVWVEIRHHTHERPARPGNGVHRQPVDDPASGRKVMQVGPERDGRYAKLNDIIRDLEADKARLIGRVEWLEGEVRRLADELLQRDDPSAVEADQIIARYEQKAGS